MDIMDDLTDLELQCLQGIRNELAVYYEEAMDGDPTAQYSLANLYLDYCPTPRFEEEAIRLLTLSAKQGNVQAKMQLSALNNRQADLATTPIKDECDDLSHTNSLSKGSEHPYKMANDERKKAIIMKLPNETCDLLKNKVFFGNIPLEKILYAGKIYKNKKHFWILIILLIPLLMLFNQTLLFTIGVALGPILLIVVIRYVLFRNLRYYYYLLILDKEAVILPEKAETSFLRFSPQSVLEIQTSSVDGCVKINVDERGLEGNPNNSMQTGTIIIKFKVDKLSPSGNWQNIEYAFLNSHFSDKMRNESKLRKKFKLAPREANSGLKNS